MATLFLICGLPGAGKTTLARRIERERGALRLAPDEWIARILADHADKAELDRLRSPVEAIQWDVALRALALGADVILEWGFWSREERARYRAIAEEGGARVRLVFLDVPLDELWARLLDGLAARFADAGAEKSGTLVRYDIAVGLRRLYDASGDAQVRTRALALIDSESDAKYRAKYASAWRGA